MGDWGDVLRELPRRVGDWMERLQGEGIRGADLVFACIGPALEIFSRYRMVETAEGREVKLAEYLEKVWEVVGRMALEQVLGTAEARARNGVAGRSGRRRPADRPLPLDAAGHQWRRTATASSRMRQQRMTQVTETRKRPPQGKAKGFSLVFDVVRRFAQPLGIDLATGRAGSSRRQRASCGSCPSPNGPAALRRRGRRCGGRLDRTRPAARTIQLLLFPDWQRTHAPQDSRAADEGRYQDANCRDRELRPRREATTLDRVHAAMLLQAGGPGERPAGADQSRAGSRPDFLRLANALSALYPAGSEEKRLLDAMLLAVPR